LLPVLKVGDGVSVETINALGHNTSPPSRFTEPTLVKKLEELGIGRPSTYASILGTIINRGYVWKKGQALVPSWTAFAVVKLMTNYFTHHFTYLSYYHFDSNLTSVSTRTFRSSNSFRSHPPTPLKNKVKFYTYYIVLVN
jgi:DNA topoisomerase-1